MLKLKNSREIKKKSNPRLKAIQRMNKTSDESKSKAKT